ncbi:MAG: phosphotransferase [Fimbriimonadaceae bacterium]|nr:phosphotransferase [Fimbriimonadaceae bacterium]
MTPRSLLEAFALDFVGDVRPMRDLGNINTDAFDVVGRWRGESGEFILQRLNTDVFPYPDRVMAGAVLWLKAQDAAIRAGLAPRDAPWTRFEFVPTWTGGLLHRDDDGRAWRLMTRVPDAVAYKHLLAVPEDRRRESVRDVGRAIALFASMGRFADVSTMRPSLPGYRDGVGYFAQLRSVLAESVTEEEARAHRVPIAEELRAATGSLYLLGCPLEETRRRRRDPAIAKAIEDVLSDEPLALTIRIGLDQGTLRPTPIHGDPKLENFLFDTGTGRIKAAVDLDTVMPLNWLADWGDAVRSLANPAGEKESDLRKIRFDREAYDGLLEGFLSSSPELPELEVAAMPRAALAQILEQCVRFLADYLRGDTYYRLGLTDPPDLNRTRALVQWRLFVEAKRVIA